MRFSLGFRSIVQRSVIRFLTLDEENEIRYVHLLFPSNQSELELFKDLLENFKEQKRPLTNLVKVAKRSLKNVSTESIDTLIRSICLDEHRAEIGVRLLEKHEEILRLVELNRPNSIKFSVIFFILSVELIRQGKDEDASLPVKTIWKILKKFSVEVQKNEESGDRTELIAEHVLSKNPIGSRSYLTLWRLFVETKGDNGQVFSRQFLSESIFWLSQSEKSSIIEMLVAENFSSNSELISFIGEFFLAENCENDRAAEILLKILLKKRQIRSVGDFDFLILILFLRSPSRSVRSVALKIFARKLSISNEHLEPIKKLVETHENEILADAQFLSRIFQFHFQSNKPTEKKKRKLNDEHFPVVQILKKTIEDQTPIAEPFQQKLKIELLNVFKSSPHPSVFESFRPIFDNLLSQNEKIIHKDTNRILLELIVDQMNEHSSCFESIVQLLQRSIKEPKSTTINALVLRFFKQVCRSSRSSSFTFLLCFQFSPEIFDALGNQFDKQVFFIEQCFSLFQRSISAELRSIIQSALAKVRFEAKHFLVYWTNLFEPEKNDFRLSNKKLILTKTPEKSTKQFDWKIVQPSLEFLHKDSLSIERSEDLIRPIFNFLEKTFSETNDEQSYIQQLCVTALTNVYNNLTPGFSLNSTKFHQKENKTICLNRRKM